MSCYLRHLDSLLAEAGIELTKENRKALDQAMHRAVGVTYKDCPVAWKGIKGWLADLSARKTLVEELRKALCE